jgi:hypothetical protein
LPLRGPVLRLDRPLSFWGGVDPATGRLLASGLSIAGTVLMLPEARFAAGALDEAGSIRHDAPLAPGGCFVFFYQQCR